MIKRKFKFRKDPVEIFKCVGGPYNGELIKLKTNCGVIKTLPFSAKGSVVGYYRCESTTKSHTLLF